MKQMKISQDEQATEDNENSEDNESDTNDESEQATDETVTNLPTNVKLITINLSVASPDFEHFQLFLQELEKLERITRVDTLTFTKPAERELLYEKDGNQAVTADVQITTFIIMVLNNRNDLEEEFAMNEIITLFFFIFGLVFGSFFNVVGLRIPKKESIVYPNSHCTKCHHELSWYENIPVLSYIFTGKVPGL